MKNYDVDITFQGQIVATSKEEVEEIIHKYIDSISNVPTGFNYPNVKWEINE